MRRPDDYSDEMFTKRLLDEDVEAVLSGRVPNDPQLAEIGRALSGLDPKRFETSDAKAAVFAQKAAALARAGEPAKLAATARYRRGLSLTPRLAPAAVAAILLFATAGVAVASDSSVPGSALYGIDRAAELIGIGDGGADERFEEATILAADGNSAEALDLLAETFDLGSSEAIDALLSASERIRQSGQGNNGAVADLLGWMAESGLEGEEFGQGVAERARALGNDGQGNDSESPGQSGETPGQSGENPSQSGEAPGKSGETPSDGGEEPGQGNQGNQGQENSGTAPGRSNP